MIHLAIHDFNYVQVHGYFMYNSFDSKQFFSSEVFQTQHLTASSFMTHKVALLGRMVYM